MTEGQKRLLARLRLDLGAILREYFSHELTIELRDKLANLIRDEAGGEIRLQLLSPESRPADDRQALKRAEAS